MRLMAKGKLVFLLMKDFLNQGHSVFMSNFYTSFGWQATVLANNVVPVKFFYKKIKTNIQGFTLTWFQPIY